MLITLTKEEFSKKVENYVMTRQSSYMDAIIYLFDEYSYDYSQAPKLLTQPILEKLEAEARELNFLPKIKNKLPFA